MASASGSGDRPRAPRHIAIIMDGNGRWAQRQGLPRLAGHRAGVDNIRPILKSCVELGVRYLTLYAFSTENWNRPRFEVDGLMRLLGEFIDRETDELHREGVQIRHLGRPEGLADSLRRKIDWATQLTRANNRITVAVALNYGGRAEIVDALRALMVEGVSPAAITEQMISDRLTTSGMPDPDLIIRTSGEVRLSNFLIWQAAYSEIWVTPMCWPDFGADALRQAVHDYGRRERRFGGVTAASQHADAD
jgi:undecaprenyl diphosphate synthase